MYVYIYTYVYIYICFDQRNKPSCCRGVAYYMYIHSTYTLLRSWKYAPYVRHFHDLSLVPRRCSKSHSESLRELSLLHLGGWWVGGNYVRLLFPGTDPQGPSGKNSPESFRPFGSILEQTKNPCAFVTLLLLNTFQWW